eukprot:m.135597 g.135597  ORF g.135597 m.135597 type:complete len:207 (-) comp17557_c0_seq1:107-727(-)
MPPPPVRGAYFAIMGRSTAPIELQAYLDYACPFCAKIFKTLYQEVIPHYGDNIQFVFKHQVQPWHPQSALMHEAGLAVKQIADTETFFKFSEKLFADQTQFFDANVWNKSRDTITKELIQLAVEVCDIDAAELEKALDILPDDGVHLNRGTKMTPLLKIAVKEGRQQGIHVSPTTLINGVVTDTSSSWSLQDWKTCLDPLLSGTHL